MNKVSKLFLGIGTQVGGAIAVAGQALAAPKVDPSIQIEVDDDFFFTSFGDLFTKVLSAVMIFAGLLVFAYLIWGGIEWITSGGDKGKTESARNKITAAIVGLIILAAAYAIFTLVLQLLGVEGFKQIFK